MVFRFWIKKKFQTLQLLSFKFQNKLELSISNHFRSKKSQSVTLFLQIESFSLLIICKFQRPYNIWSFRPVPSFSFKVIELHLSLGGSWLQYLLTLSIFLLWLQCIWWPITRLYGSSLFFFMVLTHIEFWLLPWCLINLLLWFMTEATVIPIKFHPLHWLWLSWMIGMPNSHDLWLKYTFLSMSGVLVPSKSYSSNECGSYFWFKFPDSVEWYILSLNRLSHVSITCLSLWQPRLLLWPSPISGVSFESQTPARFFPYLPGAVLPCMLPYTNTQVQPLVSTQSPRVAMSSSFVDPYPSPSYSSRCMLSGTSVFLAVSYSNKRH